MSGEKQVSQENNKSVRHASHPSRAAFACSSASVSRLHPCEQPRRVFAPSSSALQRPRPAPAGLGGGGTSGRKGGRGFPETEIEIKPVDSNRGSLSDGKCFMPSSHLHS